jgi:hypothetical protein
MNLSELTEFRMPEWTLQPGETIERKVLHSVFGGRRQGGIGPSRSAPEIFLFTDPESGLQHGYVDGWQADACFHYTGEGQRGDQQMKSGNAAILRHRDERRSLRLFEGSAITIAREREAATAELEAAAESFAAAFGRYQELTAALEAHVGVECARRIDTPLVIHLNALGLTTLLERKLAGQRVPLVALVSEQHDRLGVARTTDHQTEANTVSARQRLIHAIRSVAQAAEQVATARREVIAAMYVATKEQQHTTGRLEPPVQLNLVNFDRELGRLLAAGGFVAPFYGLSRPSTSEFADAAKPGWQPRRDADTVAAFTARWADRLAHQDVVIT